ncbi:MULTISPECIES: hypothetical protein [Staphylococcus]|jgi:hypothetical protein|uniref:Uncharacterized protein n=1 Tax=Staphylococcus equorum TaxID=246432 RepID=A0A1B1G660_9STAP|nr:MULTISPECIES: hypothetical protein [Staphylococcus]ANK37421.1 hypothetical protein AOB58_619 [Staphylococcus sp. AntiMn-1]ANQ64093.1 hypothetical protein AVJ22_05195 [Staphylococcus equorum]ANR68005.1 hypothetical protein AWC34_05315 [Staphylococcus equorum]ERH36088.1 hypothetical protein SEQU_03155 [Staphylococcus equorum UMC-CNS-924]KKI54226.1 hypothetical protein UF72_1002 [Staphylococcus equorum subsp. equorum]
MNKIKLSTLRAASLKELESSINAFLEDDEVAGYQLLNATVREVEERTYSSNEEEFNAILTFVKND